MIVKKVSVFIGIFLLFIFYQSASQPPLVVNLSEAKKAVKEYYAYRYNEEMDSIIIDAIQQVKQINLSKNS
ncbi:MAG: hypothetical protein ACK4SO_08195, partial [Candidatus Kapaibacteriota bacterium]